MTPALFFFYVVNIRRMTAFSLNKDVWRAGLHGPVATAYRKYSPDYLWMPLIPERRCMGGVFNNQHRL